MTFDKFTLAAAFALSALLAGCDTNEGPAEKAGAKIDNAMESAGDTIEETGEKIEEKAN